MFVEFWKVFFVMSVIFTESVQGDSYEPSCFLCLGVVDACTPIYAPSINFTFPPTPSKKSNIPQLQHDILLGKKGKGKILQALRLRSRYRNESINSCRATAPQYSPH